MKTLKVLLLLVCASQVSFAQHLEFGSDFNVSQPLGTMGRNMNNAFGLPFAASKNFHSLPERFWTFNLNSCFIHQKPAAKRAHVNYQKRHMTSAFQFLLRNVT